MQNNMPTDEEISKFERIIGFCLPSEYKKYLKEINGGQCKKDILTLSNGHEVFIDILYSLNSDKDYSDLLFWHNEFSTDLPENCLIIGSDPGGAMFLLLEDENTWNIYLYDHTYFFPESSDSENAYLINKKLPEILSLCK